MKTVAVRRQRIGAMVFVDLGCEYERPIETECTAKPMDPQAWQARIDAYRRMAEERKPLCIARDMHLR